MFQHDFVCMVNSIVVLLDVIVIINVFQEIIKMFHEKMLKAINLYRFPQQCNREKYFTK